MTKHLYITHSNKYSIMFMRLLYASITLFIFSINLFGQDVKWNSPKACNPILPGYFADPTIRKFGDTFYIYSTTDGTGNGYGPSQVWMSKDFVHWKNVLMNWPTTEVVWAPDVVKASDGMFHYYYCTPCEIRVGESNSPIGPWKNRLGASDAVLVPDRFVHNAITLDPMLFHDDDGSDYLYFGTWGIYKGFGCGVAKLSKEGKSFTDKKLIENTEIKDFFEAPFVFKKDGIYYFTYSSGSCHDDTYRVQYAISTVSPMGPYTYKGCILKTNSDGSVHGPGHHSILFENGNYYIVYHRHNIPQSIHGFNRQICIDKLEFDQNGNIKPVIPTHSGIDPSTIVSRKFELAENIAYGAKTIASSVYSKDFKAEYSVDDNNATLWKASKCGNPEWLQLDLGEEKEFNQIWIQFEYATFFYQYKIEISNDGKIWSLYSDKTKNTNQGSPMIETGQAKARYVRLTITDTQKNGHFPAIWNIQVYNSQPDNDPRSVLPDVEIDQDALLEGYPWIHEKDVSEADRLFTKKINHKLISINASDYNVGSVLKKILNDGIEGEFSSESGIAVVPKSGKYAFRFDGQTTLLSNFILPKTVSYNSPYTINAWILNPEIGSMECVAQFTHSRKDLATIELRNGTSSNEGLIAYNASFENSGASESLIANEWQFWSIVYDGYTESIYCNGTLVSSKNNFLMLSPEGRIIIGNSFRGDIPFDGYLHSLDFYDRPLDNKEIIECYHAPSCYTEEEASQFSALSKLNKEKIRFKITPISPDQAVVKLENTGTSQLDNNLHEFYFGDSKDNMHRAVNNEVIIKTDGRSRTIYGKVCDVFGGSTKTVKGVVKTKSRDFINLSTQLSIPLTSDGKLKLESNDTYLEYDSSKSGPLSLVDVQGDFVLECKVTDMTGLSRRTTPSYNEGGIIIVDPLDRNHHNLIHLGVFPNYNCGNMLTIVTRNGRPQYKNDKGWNYHPYLQLERRGDLIYARTSKDGINWEEMPNSPIKNQYGDKPIKIGLYQTTYTNNHAYMTFDNINIWKKK